MCLCACLWDSMRFPLECARAQIAEMCILSRPTLPPAALYINIYICISPLLVRLAFCVSPRGCSEGLLVPAARRQHKAVMALM